MAGEAREDELRKECRAKVEACLESLHGERYAEVGVEQMFGVFLLVFVRPLLAAHVGGVCAEVVRTGFGSDNLGIKAGAPSSGQHSSALAPSE